jgi:hypothetical protein
MLGHFALKVVNADQSIPAEQLGRIIPTYRTGGMSALHGSSTAEGSEMRSAGSLTLGLGTPFLDYLFDNAIGEIEVNNGR